MVAMAPILFIAYSATTACGQFGMQMRTLSSAFTPSFTRHSAKWSMSAMKSRYFSLRPMNSYAILLGYCAAVFLTMPYMDSSG